MLIIIEFLTKPNCHLCEVARAEIEKLKKEFDFEVIDVDVSKDEELNNKYGEKVPVTIVNGGFFSIFEVNSDELRVKLKSIN
jgi:hypothetical protein